jgi:hypothetical protein
LLKLANDLLYRVLSVATLDNFEAGSIEPEGAFGH